MTNPRLRPRKSSGGRAPFAYNPQPFGKDSKIHIDHLGNECIMVYEGQRASPEKPVLPPLWSFQVYVTFNTRYIDTQALAMKVLNKVTWDTREYAPFRLDFSFLPEADVETCMEHYRVEASSRRQLENPLNVVEDYETRAYKRFLILIDHSNWEDAGATVVHFDARVGPDEATVWGIGMMDPRPQAGVWVSRPDGMRRKGLSQGLVGRDEEACLADVLYSYRFVHPYDCEEYDRAIERGDAEWS